MSWRAVTTLHFSHRRCVTQDSGRNPSTGTRHTKPSSLWTKPPRFRWTWWRGPAATTSTGTEKTTPPSSCCPTRATPPWWSSCPRKAGWPRWRAASTRSRSCTGTTRSLGSKMTLAFFWTFPPPGRKVECLVFSKAKVSPDSNEFDLVVLLFLSSVDLFLPKFSISAEAALDSTLKEMGITDAFGDNADFSGMSSEVKLKVSKVGQKTNTPPHARKYTEGMFHRANETLTPGFLHRFPTRPCWVWMKQEQRRQRSPPSRSCPWACLRSWDSTDPSWSSSASTRPRASSSWARSTTRRPCKRCGGKWMLRVHTAASVASGHSLISFYLSVWNPNPSPSRCLNVLSQNMSRQKLLLTLPADVLFFFHCCLNIVK